MDHLPTRRRTTNGEKVARQIRREMTEQITRIPLEERLNRTRDLLTNDIVLQRLSKVIVESGFRDRLENIHAGIFPSSKSGDGSDIVVTSPYGEIPWNKLGRISDEEMKQLNKGAVDYIYNFFKNLLDGNLWPLLESLKERDSLPRWDAPNEDHP